MNLDKQIIKEKITEINQTMAAAVFSIGGHFVQAAAQGSGQIYAEAVSHHYHSGLGIGLEAGFAAMGYNLEEGGNYSRVYSINTEGGIDKIADDFEYIFKNLYNADPNLPFEVEDVE